jgi:CheY-like chemotaxis protein
MGKKVTKASAKKVSKASAKKASKTSSEKASKATTVMVVDDDDDIRHLMAKLLGGAGYRVVTAASGDEAQRCALEHVPQLILMDIGMPDVDGLSAVWRMRQQPELADVRIVIVSAYDSYDMRAEAASAGCHHYLTKPVDADELKAVVKEVLQA